MNESTQFDLDLEPEKYFAHLRLQAGQYFRPASPITAVEFFSGRLQQLQATTEAINQIGQHVVLYGERGVGKTSLANIFGPYANILGGSTLVTGKINCDTMDTFDSVWRKVLEEITLTTARPGVGFTADDIESVERLGMKLPKDAMPNDVRRLLASTGNNIVLVFDEFDRLPNNVALSFTDLIKSLSDYSVGATVILVGVADTVEQLIEDHGSIDRALVQVHMPRMSAEELHQILQTGASQLGISFSVGAATKIVSLSQGLPHFTHLVGLESIRSATDRMSTVVQRADVQSGMSKAVENAQQSIKSLYHKATTSARKDALFGEVLVACALAEKDQLSTFRAADVSGPLSNILKRQCEVSAFARHLSEFCEPRRGSVLKRTGERRNYRFRFTNPLMEPYILMMGFAAGGIGDLFDIDNLDDK